MKNIFPMRSKICNPYNGFCLPRILGGDLGGPLGVLGAGLADRCDILLKVRPFAAQLRNPLREACGLDLLASAMI